ncbi:MAG: tetratricopeptide repeat protein [Isosphaeraceae bacterium]
MRQSEAAVALIRRIQDGQTLWLAQWNPKWRRFHFVSGHRRPDETFRQCLVREVAEELELGEGADYQVSPAPPMHLEFTDFSESTQTETCYIMELFGVELGSAAYPKVDRNAENRWLSEAEIEAGQTHDGRPVSATMKRMLGAIGRDQRPRRRRKMRRAIPAPKYDIFVSYAHADDRDGWVAGLVEAIQAEHSRYTPEPLAVFFDRDEIRSMDDWEHRIYRGLRETTVMLAILSPNYFESPYCRKEWLRYREQELARALPGDAIAPIYTITAPIFETQGNELLGEWLADLRRRQFLDLRHQRKEGPTALRTEGIRRLIEGLEQRISERLERANRTAASPTTIPPHNQHFVGRQEELGKLRESLALGRVGAITALHGIGGMGKSALAFEYAHAFADEYAGGRYLVPCVGVSDLRIPILNLAPFKGITLTDDEKVNVDAAFIRVRAAFEERPRSLLLLDNVDDPQLLAPHTAALFLPSGDSTHVLVTTQLGSDQLTGVDCLPLDGLPEEHAMRLLEIYKPFATEDERNDARWIIQRLEGHPLAVEVVAVYLWQTPEVSYAGFADRLAREGIGAMTGVAGEEGMTLSRHPEKSLPVLLKPILASLSEQELLALQYAALFPHGRIPIPWLRSLVGARIPEFNDERPGYPSAWGRLLRHLRGLRLLLDGEGEGLLRMHTLIQDVVCAGLAADVLREGWVAVVAHVGSRAASLSSEWDESSGRWEIDPMCDFATLLLDNGWIEGGAILAIKADRLLGRQGRFNEGRALLQRAIRKLEATHSENTSLLAACCGNLGDIELKLGNLVNAKRLLEQALALDKQAERTNEVELAIHCSGLGVVQHKLGNLPEAKRLAEQALAIAEKACTTEEPTLAACYSNLATIAGDLGSLDDSARMLRKAIAMAERGYKLDHAALATLCSNLASIELERSNLPEARDLSLRAVAHAHNVYEADHPAFITIYANLAMAELKLKNPCEAKRLLEKAIEIGRDAFGPEHHEFATQLSNLATVEQSMGNYGDVRRLMERAYEIRLARLGPEHPLTRSSANWLLIDDEKRAAGTQSGD